MAAVRSPRAHTARAGTALGASCSGVLDQVPAVSTPCQGLPRAAADPAWAAKGSPAHPAHETLCQTHLQSKFQLPPSPAHSDCPCTHCRCTDILCGSNPDRCQSFASYQLNSGANLGNRLVPEKMFDNILSILKH